MLDKLDNLKVGILINRKYEDPVVNHSYQELADLYHTALLPARVLASRDKAAVEGLPSSVPSSFRKAGMKDFHCKNADDIHSEVLVSRFSCLYL